MKPNSYNRLCKLFSVIHIRGTAIRTVDPSAPQFIAMAINPTSLPAFPARDDNIAEMLPAY